VDDIANNDKGVNKLNGPYKGKTTNGAKMLTFV